MRRFHPLRAVAAALALIAIAGTAHAENRRPEVRAFNIDCDGGDCARRMAIFLGDDDRLLELASEGLVHWTGGHRFAFRTLFAGGAYLGVQLTELTPELRAHFGVPEDAGVLVSKVVDDTPASRAGLAVGDIITAIDGEAVDSATALAHAVRSTREGETVTLELWRDGRVQTLTAAPEERSPAPHAMRHIRVQCDDEGDDCASAFVLPPPFECGEGESCDVRIRCEDGDCECTLDGEEVDCADVGAP